MFEISSSAKYASHFASQTESHAILYNRMELISALKKHCPFPSMLEYASVFPYTKSIVVLFLT